MLLYYQQAQTLVPPLVAHQDLIPSHPTQYAQSKLPQPERASLQPALPIRTPAWPRISQSVQDPRDVPRRTHRRRALRILQPADQHRGYDRWMILQVVGMRALSAVEFEGG